jgi:TonB-linked SusC/RagA family outer membrane protein
MSSTPSTTPRPARRIARIATAVAASGLLMPAHAPARAQGAPVHATSVSALLERPARLRVRDVSLADALGELERRSGVPLAYSPSLLPRGKSLRCACDGATIAQALQQLLAEVPFTYRETDGQVVVVPMPRDVARDGDARRLADAVTMAAAENPGALGIVMPATLPAVADSATVTGRVTSDAGTPIPAAVVAIPSLRLTTTTNDAGVYRITVPPDRFVARSDTLRVTRLGYRPATIRFNLTPGRITVDVTLSSQAVSLEQVVVTGTAGNQERRAQAAVVASIDASAVVKEAPVTSVTQLLGARVPGVVVTDGSGNTGSATRILVRGASSISLSNQPLVFIDGVRMDGGFRGLFNVSGSGSATSGQAPSTLNDLNPNDIESIEIVKGPAAATLYGADASAGVIQIITKKGRVGARSFTQDVSTEYNTITPNFTVPTNYATCNTAALIAPTSPNPLCRGQTLNAIIADNPAERMNAFRNGWMQSGQYSVRGGGESYGFFASGGITNEQGTTLNNTMKQRSGRGSFTFTPNGKLTFDLNFALTRNSYDLPRTDQDTYGYYVESAFGNPRTVTKGAPPTAGGDSIITGGTLLGGVTLESMSSILTRSNALRTMPSVQMHYAPISWFTNRVTLGADVTQSDGFELFPKNSFGWYPTIPTYGNQISTTRINDRLYTVDYLGNIRVELGSAKQISSDLSFGSQFINRSSDRLSGAGQGLISNDASLVTNATVSTIGQGYGESRSVGYFAQEQVGFKDRLFLQFGLRADRNSAFGSDVGTFYLPKFGASYVISEEPFWKGLASSIPTLRLRAAYGTTGRSPSSGANQTYVPSKFINEAGAVELGVSPGDPGNPDLKPERGKEFEAGFDAGFLDDRYGLELTYFNKKSTDLIVNVPTAPSSGFGGSIANIGEVQNTGWEFLLRASPLRGSTVAWDATLSGSTLHNEILELGTVGTFINNFRAFTEGRQIAAFWANKVRRVDVGAGRAIVSDTAEFIGNQLPTFQGTLTNMVTLLRNIRVYAQLEGKTGYYSYNVNQENRDRSRLNSFEVVNPADKGGYSAEERLRRLGPYVSEKTGAAVGVANVKDPYMQKADHLRLREVSVTYLLPTSLLRAARVTGASLTVGGRNLALWKSDYEGDDPDVLGLGTTTQGINQLFTADVFTTPPNRRFIVRLNVQF